MSEPIGMLVLAGLLGWTGAIDRTLAPAATPVARRLAATRRTLAALCVVIAAVLILGAWRIGRVDPLFLSLGTVVVLGGAILCHLAARRAAAQFEQPE